jgi:sugar/nucleoside kinase (ribokinase family)
MHKVLTIGGATLDTIISYEDMETLIHQRKGASQSYLLLEEGKKIEVTQQEVVSGGGATNTAVAFKRQGYEVILFCKIGRDLSGQLVLKELQDYGLNTQYISYDEKVATATSFIVPSLKGDRAVFAYRGANANLLMKDLALEHIKECQFIYITSLSKASAEQLPQIVTAANKAKVPVAINPGVSQLQKGAEELKKSLPGIDIFILNEEEAKTFMVALHGDSEIAEQTGAKRLIDSKVSFTHGYFNLREFFKKVLDRGPRVVVVTNGSEGVYVATREKLYFHKAPKIKVINTLGAGDAFGSGFTGALYKGHAISDAIRMGVLNSASVIQYSGAKKGLLTTEQLHQCLQESDASLLSELNW